MITNHTRLIGILLLGLGMLSATPVFALEITDIEPNSAAQGTVDLPVHIYGSSFDKNTTVAFLLDGSPAPGITVRSTRTLSSGEIVANIDIAVDAAEANYLLQVSQRRGGKGTTTASTEFTVTRGNLEIFDCGGANGVFKNVVAGACDCTFAKKDEGGQGTPSAWIWVLQSDCTTSATLKLPQYEVINGNGNELRAIPDAEGDFNGSSVITNTGHRTHVFQLDISVDGNIQNFGCGDDGSDLNSAISFVLDDTKEHPEESTDKDGRTYALTRLRTWGVNVDSEGPLCHAIEFRRDPSYDQLLADNSAELSQPPEYYTDAVVLVGDVTITSGSFSRAGIRVSGFVNAGQSARNVDKIGIEGSTVTGTAAPGYGAIRFGPIWGPGTVAQNVVNASGGTGISLEGGDGFDDVRIENNNVTGANIAIRADGLVEEAYFKSNVLQGPGSHGIQTLATDNVYRSNRFSGFGCDVEEHGICQP